MSTTLNQAATPVAKLTFAERANFLVTNRLPRRWLTLAMGRFSRIENPVVRKLSIGLWKLFVDDLRLHEARKPTFRSLHDCFVRELKDGARPTDGDPDVLASPCDAVIGESGRVCNLRALQAKGYPYSVAELLGDEQHAMALGDARYVTLRIKSSMYHHFHSPCDGTISSVRYISGDTWNVNPIALKVVERLFCRNERAVIQLDSDDGPVTIVAVAAILVASMRIHGIDVPLNLRYRGPNEIQCQHARAKGDAIGYFEHGSTIVMLVGDKFRLEPALRIGDTVRAGQALFRRNLSDKQE